MKKRFDLSILILTIIVYLSPSVCLFGADPDSSAGTAAASFLKIGVGARPCGMGECFVAVADDVNALSWNPAGITQLKKIQATFMHNTWPGGISYEYLGATYPLGYESTVGASIIMLDYGKIEGRDNADNLLDDYEASDFVIAGTYGGVFEENILVGVTLKSIQQKIEDESAGASFGVDIGGIYKLSENLSIGVAVQNFTVAPIKFVEQGYSLPMNIKIGVGFKTSGYSFENPTIFAADFNKPSDNSANVGFGGEYWLSELFVARAGYKMQLGGSSDLGGTVGLTAGCGLKYILQGEQSLEIDLAIIPYGSIGNSIRLSILLKFG